ncbi:MAG: selenocysteine-specific translation elongation factor [Myxococcota bacterium]
MGPAERRLILGTAGHIDHGKTALCRALTGVETDRLPEEKKRGITIELGFAPLDLPDGTRLGVVDVPGHEALVRTMVAGAAGIDLLLLVVAADEGVMPQTREHLAICSLLGIREGVVALTKIDLVDEEMLELASEEVRDLLAPTLLRDAPLLGVSSETGAGLDALREALSAAAQAADARTPRQGPPRLPIDRSFEMRGFGPVVTGTLLGSAFAVGDSVALLPGEERARIRGLQSHGESVERVEPGARCAVNLQGVALEDLSRGQVVSPVGALPTTTTLDVRLHWLPEAPDLEEPTSIAFLSGTTERLGRVAPIGAARLDAGGSGFARIHLEGEPVAVLPGDHFVLRGFARTAVGATLGGGTLLDIAPPHRRRSDPALVSDLEILERREPSSKVSVRVQRSGLAGVERETLARETGQLARTLDAILAEGERDGWVRVARERCISGDALDELESRLRSALDDYHRAEPLRPGMPAGALRGVLPDNVHPASVECALERLAASGEVVRESDHVRLASHRPSLDAESEKHCATLVERLGTAGLEAPSLRDLGEATGLDEGPLRDLLAHLAREGRIVPAPGDLWFDAAAVESLRDRVRAHFESNDALDTKAFKALIGTTRRTAVPLMELLDAERFTVRRGDVRLLRDAAQPRQS